MGAALGGEGSVATTSAEGVLCARPWAYYVPHLTSEETGPRKLSVMSM